MTSMVLGMQKILISYDTLLEFFSSNVKLGDIYIYIYTYIMTSMVLGM